MEPVTVAHVTPGGPARRLDAAGLVALKASVSAMDNNCYVLAADGAAVVIDAADDAPRVLALLGQARAAAEAGGEAGAGDTAAAGGAAGAVDTAAAGGAPSTGDLAGVDIAVVTTHRHHDHVGALRDVVAATGARVLAGADDADALPVPVDVRLRHGDRVPLGDRALEVVALRGHTPGSVALAWTEAEGEHAGRVHLFTGDSLFPGGPGRTTSPEDFAALMDDLTERVFARFDDDTRVHPGHGDSTTLGRERPHLEEWRRRGW
ncbi:MBL fold metallo-hydrolase [Georgenia faecalis]|uniref:MBL fold metallo-hydrolase n=1 Tax=Georgenia faecalis TaxID=2483799 RepID=A0ABV9DBL0_9MICO|nr:MBL fold metallo-hydrolase [Georgenia faecalis]